MMSPVTVRFSIEVLNHTITSKESLSDVSIWILGSAEELGSWNSKRAARMEMIEMEANKSTWQLQICIHRTSSPLEYKYIMKSTLNDTIVCWEAIPGNRTINLSHGTNVAMSKPSTQSSVYRSTKPPVPGPRGAHLGNDGKRNGYYEWNCCQTLQEQNPWWQVDLERVYTLSSIHLWKALTYHDMSREPSCFNDHAMTSSLNKYPVWVFISELPLEECLATLKNRAANGEIYGRVLDTYCEAVQKSPVVSLFFEPTVSTESPVSHAEANAVDNQTRARGRFIRIQVESSQSSLRFAECEVFACNTQDSGSPIIHQDDGIFGFENSLDGQIHAMIDHGWVDPYDNKVELDLGVEGFDDCDFMSFPDNKREMHDAITMSVEFISKRDLERSAPAQNENSSSWKSICIDSYGSYSTRSSSDELIADFLRYQSQESKPVAQYLNNSGTAETDASCSETSTACVNDSQGDSTHSWLRQLPWVNRLNPAELIRLQNVLQQRTYEANECLLAYGERVDAMWYIVSGAVQLNGPMMAGKGQSLGLISAGSYFNELSLFGEPSHRCASFVAEDTVKTEMILREDMIRVLGHDRALDIRRLIIETMTLHIVPPTPNKQIRLVNKHGYLFRLEVPCDFFDADTGRPSKFFLELKFHAVSTDNTKRQVGSAVILSSQLHARSEGAVKAPVVARTTSSEHAHVLGEVTVRYLSIKPMVHANNTLQCVWRSYWRERPPLNIGHRGMGMSYREVSGFRRALFRENSLASFIMAGRSGADFVEFDVQLTKDRVPILYHDFRLIVGLEDQNARAKGTRPEEHLIGIHELTYRQLKHCTTKPNSHSKSLSKNQKLRQLILKHWEAILAQSTVKKSVAKSTSLLSKENRDTNVKTFKAVTTNATVPDATNLSLKQAIDELDYEHLVDFFPRLKDLLHYVPAHIGFNVEIKYPNRIKYKDIRQLEAFDLNTYIDAILECIFHYAGSRRIFFSSFDINVCIMLRRKQAKYPVLLLNCGMLRCPDSTPVQLTLQYAVTMAEIEDLRGIVVESTELLNCLEIIPYLKQTKPKMMILTWGDINMDFAAFQAQKQSTVDAVISDNMGDLIRQERKCSDKIT